MSRPFQTSAPSAFLPALSVPALFALALCAIPALTVTARAAELPADHAAQETAWAAENAAAWQRAEVRSRDAFVALLQTNPRRVPYFTALVPEVQRAFISSLVFTDRGLGSCNPQPLLPYLSGAEIDDLFGKLFGQPDWVRDIKNRYTLKD